MYGGASSGDEIVASYVRFFYRTSYAGLTSRQSLVTLMSYLWDCVKRLLHLSRRRLAANCTSFITRILRLCFYDEVFPFQEAFLICYFDYLPPNPTKHKIMNAFFYEDIIR